jgi:hypothetical protein
LIAPGTFPAIFPNDAGGPKLTIAAGVSAGQTILQALQAVADFQFAAFNRGLPIGMKTALHKDQSLIIF